ncbi:MAG: hypothetical protein K2X91_04200 [Thermoleophilia bacterium]|nr:hypothetical protein [Thermoleophilia bacterium]
MASAKPSTAETTSDKRRALQRDLAALDLTTATAALAILSRPGFKSAIADLRALWDEAEAAIPAHPGQVHVNAEVGYVVQVGENVPVSLERAVAALEAIVNPPAEPEAPAPAAADTPAT